LLYQIDDGYCPTDTELQDLERVDSLWIEGEDLRNNMLPNSIYYLENIRNITLFHIASLSSFEPLLKVNKLININIIEMLSIPNLSLLANIIDLEGLHIYHAPVPDISVVKNLPNLKSLVLQHTDVKSIEPIQDHPNLNELYLYSNPILDYSQLATISKLRKFGCGDLQTFSPEFGQWISEVTELIIYNSKIPDWTDCETYRKLENMQIMCYPDKKH
jgi:Leucine-rich repeat (LRR) protein